MSKKLTTTEISRLSGVSRGTVDRILHNRGSVSESSRLKVQAVLDRSSYKVNLHTSAVPFRKVFHLLVCLPKYSEDDFWSQIRCGISRALEEYSDIDIELTDLDFAPFDGQSYIGSIRRAVEGAVDGVILSPVFPTESYVACRMLDERKIPYVFVDMDLDEAHPLAVFSIDQFAGGRIAAMLADSLAPSGSEIGIFFVDNARGTGRPGAGYREAGSVAGHREAGPLAGHREAGPLTGHRENTRRAGVEAYFAERLHSGKVHCLDLDIATDDGLHRGISRFMALHPAVRCISVTSAHGSKVSQCLSTLGLTDVILISFDLTRENSDNLERGVLKAVICQRPETQGYKATLEILHHFLYRTAPASRDCFQSIDVIFRDNMSWYKDLDR